MRRFLLMMLIAGSTSGCRQLLPPGDITTPQYWADFFLNKYADDLVVGALEAGPEPLAEPRTVLLVTGVTIPAVWFDPIVARLRRDGFDPVVYEPPALLTYDLFEATEDLAEVVERVKAESGQDRVDILAECTGGVIARHYIQSMDGEAHVDRMVTFVSPQHGVDAAPWAATFADWPALHHLTPGSDFLRAVNDAPLPETTDLTSIYTCTDEYIQPWETAIIPGATNINLCDGGRAVDHFETFFDPEVYLLMHGALTRPLRNPPAAEAPIEPAVDEEPPAELAAAEEGFEEPEAAEAPAEPLAGEEESAEPAEEEDPAELAGDELAAPGDQPAANEPELANPFAVEEEPAPEPQSPAPVIVHEGCSTSARRTGFEPAALLLFFAAALRSRRRSGG